MSDNEQALPPKPEDAYLHPEEAVPRWAPLAILGFVALVICTYVGTAVAAPWSDDRPAELLALSSRVRHLVLALANDVDLVAYFVIPTLRLSAAFAVCHLIGRAYGPQILNIFGKYLGVTNAQMDSIFATFEKAEWAIVSFFVGSNMVAAISGIMRIPPKRLAKYVAAGLAARLLFYYGLSLVFASQLESVAEFISRYQRPFFIGSIVLVVVGISINISRGRNFSR